MFCKDKEIKTQIMSLFDLATSPQKASDSFLKSSYKSRIKAIMLGYVFLSLTA